MLLIECDPMRAMWNFFPVLVAASVPCIFQPSGVCPAQLRGLSQIQTVLTSNFASSKLVDFVKSDSSCRGYFGYAGGPGQPRYVSVCRNKADYYEIKFIRYNYKNEKLEVAEISEISEDTAEALLSILRDQITRKQNYVQGVLDGSPHEFGIRRAGSFDCAGVNPSDASSIIRMMCNIAGAKSVKDIEELLKKWKSEFVERFNDKFISLNLSKDTAIKLAEATLVSIYGANVLKQRPWIVEENGKSIKIMGQLPSQAAGGVAEIEIRRSDGKVMRCQHGK